MRRVFSLVFFCCFLLAPFTCFAQSVGPQPLVWGEFTVNGYDVTFSNLHQTLNTSYGNNLNGYHAVVTGGHAPSASLAEWATSNPDDRSSAWAAGYLGVEYYYIIHSNSNDPVPVTWSYAGGISTTASGSQISSYVHAIVIGGDDVPDWPYAYGCGDYGPPDACVSYSWSGAGTSSGFVTPNSWSAMDLYMSAGVFLGGTSNGGFSVFADPTLTIDPAWLALHPGTYIDFNSPVSPTPEPASLILLGTGIVGAAGAIRRRLVE